MSKRRQQQIDPAAVQLAAQALDTWNRTGGPQRWRGAVASMLLSDWNGERIAWPQCADGEVFDIVRVRDGSVIDEEELLSEDAHHLKWVSVPVHQTN